MHGCFYPKHIFLRETSSGFEACLIDLEKTRPLRFGKRDRVKDLEPLLRRISVWNKTEVEQFLRAYLGGDAGLAEWMRCIQERGMDKRRR